MNYIYASPDLLHTYLLNGKEYVKVSGNFSLNF